MKLYYDPLDKACKSHTGAVARGTRTTFSLYCRQGGEDIFSADCCALLLRRDGEAWEEFPLARIGDRFAVTLYFHETGLYFYRFQVGELSFGRGRLRRGEFGTEGEWQITVFDENYATPEWFKGGVMYQIFPDRFAKSGEYPLAEHKIMRQWGEMPYFRPNEFGQVLNNDFFGGNLGGIREKLGYLKELGVNVLYLNPIFEAFSNHRYDTGDYTKIDPLLGTEEDLDALVQEADALGIKIILDGVFNHTGADSRYFNLYGRYDSLGAYQSPESPYADWYHFHPFPDGYDCWWGIRTLPAVNEQSESYREFILGKNGVVRRWLRHGIAGYRLDVADELPGFFLKELRKTAKEENSEALILGEVWEDASNKVSYGVRRQYFQGSELDSVMNYPLKNAIIHFVRTGRTEELRETLAMLRDNYPAASLNCLMNILGTHDTPRILTVLGGKDCTDKEEMARTFLSDEEKQHARELLKMAALLQFTLPGVPCIYYGDENGMEGYSDPFCRGCYDWEHPDEELRAFYRKLGALRHGVLAEAFREGEYEEIYADASCLVYTRKAAMGVYVFVNHSATEYKVKFTGKLIEYLSGETYSDTMTLRPHSYGVLSPMK